MVYVWAIDGPFQTCSSSRLDTTGPRAVRTRLESSLRHLGPNFRPRPGSVNDSYEYVNIRDEKLKYRFINKTYKINWENARFARNHINL